MNTKTRSLLDLTAADLMSRAVVTINRKMSLREAAHQLRRADVTGAPVVDERGQCVGVLSAVDLLRWSEEGGQARTRPIRTCLYQTEGRLLNGQEAVICTLGPGACPLQTERAMTGGRHTMVCQAPHEVLSDWQQAVEDTSADKVARYMTMDVVIAAPATPVAELARMMIDAHIHRVVIVGADGRPVGVVSATDVLAAVVREEAGARRPQ